MATTFNTTLEVLSGVEVRLVVSTDPWNLDVQTLVVAVGPGGFGGLGRAMSQRLPAAFATDISFSKVTPEHPMWYSLGNSKLGNSKRIPPVAGLQSVILATAHDAEGRSLVKSSSPPTIRAAATGLARALQLAADHGCARVGTTLLGTGLIGFDVTQVAGASVPQIRSLILDGHLQQLQQIVLIAADSETATAIESAWRLLASSGRSDDELLDLLDRMRPQLKLSASATALLTQALSIHRLAHLFGPFPERDDRLVGEELLFQAFEIQRERQRPDVATALLNRLASTAGDKDPRDFGKRIRSARSLLAREVPPVSFSQVADAGPLVEQAGTLAIRTTGAPNVHQRHLLAAALLARPLVDPVQRALGVDDAGLRRCLRLAIADVLPSEAPSAWDDILLSARSIPGQPHDKARAESAAPIDEQYSATDLAGGYSTDLVDPEEAIPAADDLLGINTYVSMLANVIASSDTPLPLSIGLFGAWGSGKSFFMGRLRHQVADLSKQDGYLPHIEQIGFNAWHYAETNLWASLGDEIFRQLARPQAGQQGDQARRLDEERRAQLVQDLGKTLSRERELEAATENAQRQSSELRTQLDAARDKQKRTAGTLLQSIAGSPTLQKQLNTAWQHLGVRDDTERGELLANEIRGVNQNLGRLRQATVGRRGIGLAAVTTIAVLLIAAGALATDTFRHWLLGAGLLGIGGGLATLTGLVGRAEAGARLLATVATEVRQATDEVVSKKVREQVAKLNRAEADTEILRSQLDEVRTRAGEIGRQLAELAPGQRFYGFVADRAASQDYQSKLGLISTIRRDFEKLIELMRDWRDHPAQHGNHQPIDRIVLYIDDLDRCSPSQVVEVLQAVHLLLALDLFVVVVGVDPRWLLHSLEQRYQDSLATKAVVSADGRHAEADAWDASPLNYLEKIFNIPFVLPGMTPGSFADLISGWSGSPVAALSPSAGAPRPIDLPLSDVADDDARPRSEPTTNVALAASSDHGRTESAPVGPLAGSGVAADVPVEDDSDVDRISRGDRPKPRPLSPDEIKHLRALAPLVQTPREAKRVFNLYRTLRASGNLSPASAFLGDEQVAGDFQAVIVLLGLLTAEPRLLGELLWSPSRATLAGSTFAGGICHRPSNVVWSELLDGLAPRPGQDGWCNDLGEQDQQPGSWEQVLPRLRRASSLVTLTDLTAFQRWGPLVARFSFVLSPLAGEVTGGTPVAQLTTPDGDQQVGLPRVGLPGSD